MTRLVLLLLLALAPPLAAQTTTSTTLPPCDPSVVPIEVEPSGLRYWLKRQCNWHEEMRHNVLVLNDRVLLGPFTVAELQALDPSENANRVATVRDAAVAGSCSSGGGTARALCQSTGTAWVPLGDGGSGGGGGTTPYLAFSTCGPIDGTTPVFLAPGGCGDPAELNAQGRLKAAGTYGNISCFFSGATGAQSITGTFRVGACGGSLSGTAVNCTMGPGAGVGTCEGANVTATSAGQCVSLRASGTGLVTTPGTYTCLVERVG